MLSHARIAIRQILRIGARGVNRWDIGAGLLQGLSAREAAKIKGAQTFAPSPVDSGEGASATVSWIATAFLDAVFGFLLGSILMPVVNVLLVPIGVLFPEK